METLLSASLLASALCGAASAATLWEENFNNYSDGTTNGAAGKWSVDISACSFDGDDHFEVRNGQMQGNDLDGVAVWTSESIPISGQGTVAVSASISDEAGGLESSDYIRLYYKLDGGTETLFETNGDNSGNFGNLTAAQSGLNGSSLQLIIRVTNGANTEFISFDDIVVSSSGAPANNPPVLAAIGNQSVTLSNALNFTVSATDADNDPIVLSVSNLPPGAVFNTVTNAGSVSNSFNWAVAAPTGTYTTTFYADDGTTNDFETITITVSNAPLVNVAPVLNSIGSKATTEGQPLIFLVSASDANNDSLTYWAENLPPGATFPSNTILQATFSWSSAEPTGVYTSRFYVSDGITNDFEDVVITVSAPPNNPPVIQPIGNRSVLVSNTLSFTVSAGDVDDDIVTLSASNLPPGAVFDTVSTAGAISNIFSWIDAAPAGIYTTRFYAADSNTNVFEEITITVSEPPRLMITEVADPAGTGGGDYRFVEIYNAGNSPVILDGELWFLSKQVNGGTTWTDTPLIGTLPARETLVVAYSSSKFQEAYGFAPDQSNSDISGTGDDAYFLYSGGDHTVGTLVDIYGEFDTDGTGTAWDYTDSRAVRKASTSGSSTNWISSEWVIIPGATTDDMDPGAAFNVPPVLAPIGGQGGIEGGEISFSIMASDLADGDAITLNATNLPTGSVFTNDTFFWATAAPVGEYDVTFTATDKDGSDSEVVTITVLKKPLLLISEIADPSGDGADSYRFIEIYNADTNSIDLAADSWHLSRQNNGSSWYDVPLTGTVASAGTYLVAKSRDDFFNAYEFYPDQESSTVDGNGNDSYVLYSGGDHDSGVLIDIYGEIDVDGTDTDWEYTDGRAVRHNEILEPNTVWNAAEWTITSDSTTNNMSPGNHGPVPEFSGLEDVFVWLGDDLNLTVTAANTSRTDVIYLFASLPDGATFPFVINTNTASGILSWIDPPVGVYTATFAAFGDAGVSIQSITITVSSTAKIDGKFYGWRSDTIVKLQNGQFWRNTGGSGTTFDPPLRYPDVTITNRSGERRMIITDVTGYKTVAPIQITESRVTNNFSGLHHGNVYQLEDGTSWTQISSEEISSSENFVTAWHWMENNQTHLRLIDIDNKVIGSCIVEPANMPANAPIQSRIDGYFRGWKRGRVFTLQNGQFWQQVGSGDSIETLGYPSVTITNWLQTGIWRMRVNESLVPPLWVDVQLIENVTKTQIDGRFYGFSKDIFFHLINGEWWKQTSSENNTFSRPYPVVMIWSKEGIDYLEMPDIGQAVQIQQLAVIDEGIITNTFSGMQYGSTYETDTAGKWLQVSFDREQSISSNPSVMLWSEDSQTKMVIRSLLDETIGTCTVVDPDEDADGDQVANAAELIAGTALDDAEDLFLISDILYDELGRAVLSWNAIEGRSYSVEWTPSLNETFQPLESGIEWPQNTWIDTVNPPASGGFYRLRVQLEN